MAKRTQRAAQRPRRHLREGAAATLHSRGTAASHFVVFQLADGQFGFRLDDVGEIVRIPRLAHMPLGPRSLLGLANLHGAVLPVVGLRRLLGLPDVPLDDAMRVIVIDRGAPVGFVVDRIENLAAVPPDRVEKDDAGAGGDRSGFAGRHHQGRRRRKHDQDSESRSGCCAMNSASLGSRSSVRRQTCRFHLRPRPQRWPRRSERYRWSASTSASRNMPCRSIACARSSNCRSRFPRSRDRKPPCSAS